MIYLDPSAAATPPEPNCQVVDTEVAFMRAAGREGPLLIRGSELCRWAQAYYRSRGITVETLQSPAQAILEASRNVLTLPEAELIAARVRNGVQLPKLPSLFDVAQAIWGNTWWGKRASPSHAAVWLVWRLEATLSPEEERLVRILGQAVIHDSAEPWSAAYCAGSTDELNALFLEWNGLSDNAFTAQKFPEGVQLGQVAEDLLRDSVRHRFRAGGIEALAALFMRSGSSMHTLEAASRQIVAACRDDPTMLDPSILELIDPFIDVPTSNELRALMPAASPGPVPPVAEDIAQWFINEYLPYRQSSHQQGRVIEEAAQDFASVFLPMYVNATAGHSSRDMLSWVKARSLVDNSCATILVVLDGLAYVDMVHVWNRLRSIDTADRFTVLSTEVAFASIPTVTHCCKPALLTGFPPRSAASQAHLGKVLTADGPLAEAARGLRPGELIIWSLVEPDKTYHQNSELDRARIMAQGALNGIAQRLYRIIEGVPPDVQLRVVITTDHGRLLGASERSVEVPNGMTSYQRAALGRRESQRFPEQGFTVEGGIAFLDRDRFWLEDDAAIILSDRSFLTNDGRQGTDAYPHGGVYPEEVLIPWWTLGRDVKLPTPRLQIRGDGVAGRRETLSLDVTNSAVVPLVLHRVEISWLERPLLVTLEVPPDEDRTATLEIAWPHNDDVQDGSAIFEFSYAGRTPTRASVERLAVVSRSLFDSDDDILEDLL